MQTHPKKSNSDLGTPSQIKSFLRLEDEHPLSPRLLTRCTRPSHLRFLSLSLLLLLPGEEWGIWTTRAEWSAPPPGHGSGSGMLFGGRRLAQGLPRFRALYGPEWKGVTSFLPLHLGLDLTPQTSDVLDLYT